MPEIRLRNNCPGNHIRIIMKLCPKCKGTAFYRTFSANHSAQHSASGAQHKHCKEIAGNSRKPMIYN